MALGRPGDDGTQVLDNRIEDTAAQAGGSGQNGNAINVFRAHNVTVRGNRIRNAAFSAVRGNAASNIQITNNTCTGLGEVAIYAEFGFEGAVIANNTIDGAAIGVAVTNFNHGGRLAVVQGNLIRNLVPKRPAGTDPNDGNGIGIGVEADTAVTGNIIENAPVAGISVGWGQYLRDVSVTGNVVRSAGVGIAVSVTPGAGSAVIADNLISGTQERRDRRHGPAPRHDRRSRARGRGALRAACDQRQPGALATSPLRRYSRRMSNPSAKEALAALWRLAGQPDAALDALTLTGSEPALPSSFAVGTAAQASIAASALAAAELWRLRTGRQQQVSVDMRDAAIEFRSERYLRVGGEPPKELWDKIAGLYRCGDGRWVRLHTNFPHHRDGVLKLLGCDYSREAVQRALDGWEAEKFETAAARGRTGRHDDALLRRMGRASARAKPSPRCRSFTIEKIGDAPPQPLAARRPAALRRARARSHARDRRPGVRAHARGPRRRRAAGDRARTCRR